jgi:hypothetical protein
MPSSHPDRPNETRRPSPRDRLPKGRRLPPRRDRPATGQPPTDPAEEPPAVEAEFEIVVDEPPPVTKVVIAGEDEPPEEKLSPRSGKPRRKRNKKKRRPANLTPEQEEAERQRENTLMDWSVPVFLCLLGLTMAIIGTVKAAGSLGAMVAVAVVLGMTLVLVPVMIAALMFIGMLVGIEYGTLTSTVRNLSAIVLMVQGVLFLGMGLHLPCIIVYGFTPLMTFGMFMTLFRLDAWETWITVTMLDGMQTVFSMVFFLVILGILIKGADKVIENAAPPPGRNQNRQWNPGPQRPPWNPGPPNRPWNPPPPPLPGAGPPGDPDDDD